ncbi:MAG: hypothetical protein C3F11_09000 [Methylocystaceae bacterium]|nr:MAG: hypothetical protein C3F11_09000 [Methylocystaceae bacterium]
MGSCAKLTEVTKLAKEYDVPVLASGVIAIILFGVSDRRHEPAPPHGFVRRSPRVMAAFLQRSWRRKVDRISRTAAMTASCGIDMFAMLFSQ